MYRFLLALILTFFWGVSIAQDHPEQPVAPDNTIHLLATGRVNTLADSIRITCTIFISDEESPVEAVKGLRARSKSFLKELDLPLAETAPVTSFMADVTLGRAGVYYPGARSPYGFNNMNPDRPIDETSKGSIFSQKLTVCIHNIGLVSKHQLMKLLAEIIQNFHAAIELTPTPDVTFPVIEYLPKDLEVLRDEAQHKAMESAKKEAEGLAAASGRHLGRCLQVKHLNTDDDIQNFSSQITLTTKLELLFEMTD